MPASDSWPHPAAARLGYVCRCQKTDGSLNFRFLAMPILNTTEFRLNFARREHYAKCAVRRAPGMCTGRLGSDKRMLAEK